MLQVTPTIEHPDLAEWDFRPGDQVVMEHVNAGGLMGIDTPFIETVTPIQYAPPYVHDWAHYEEGDEIGIVRPGGIGDIVFLSPFVREIKQRHPQVKVTLFSFPRYFDAGREIFDKLDVYPMHADRLAELAALVWLENVVENNPAGESTTYFDLLAQRFGFHPSSQKWDWVITPDEANFAREKYPKGSSPRIGVQCYASSPVRSWPSQLLSEFISRCVQQGWQPFLFGKPGDIKGQIKGAVNLSQHGLNLRQSAAVLDTCDVVVAPDSALCHIGAALGKPVVALYGPFPSGLRVAGHPNVKAIEGRAECAPCFWHCRLTKWPKGKPCAVTNHCKAMADIKPERVIREVKKRLEEVK